MSLGTSCQAEINFNMVLEGTSGCVNPSDPASYLVTVMNQAGQVIPTSPFVDASHLGQVFSVKVKHLPSGNQCWGSIYVNDGAPPVLICPPDAVISCTAVPDTTLTGNALVSDCSSVTVSYFDQVTEDRCANPFRTIERTWVAVDSRNNQRSCVQTISVGLPYLSEVVFPPNRDGATMLDCANADTTTANTGVPTLAGAPIVPGAQCDLTYTYTDLILPLCANSYKIIRTWTVASWCVGQLRSHDQVIKVGDTTPPVITCPLDYTANTNNGNACSATVALPSVIVDDNCSLPVRVQVFTPFGVIYGNGGIVQNVGLGSYPIRYEATDACGNTSSCTINLTVEDQKTPTVICDAITRVALSGAGYADIPATVFDDGSTDNCCLDRFEVRRMTPGCGVGTDFGPTVRLCCEDAPGPVQVVMRVVDCFGNSSACMVSVVLEENVAPTISCPYSRRIRCWQDFTDLSLTGEATAVDNCENLDTLFYTDQVNLNGCGEGTVLRTWRAIDQAGNSSSCDQLLTITDNTQPTITWPRDLTVFTCGDASDYHPDSLATPYDYPSYSVDCELFYTNFEDRVFTTTGDACIKIERSWTLEKYCQAQVFPGNGLYTHKQLIVLKDTVAPTFDCPQDTTYQIVGNGCTMDLTLRLPTLNDCSDQTTLTVLSDLGTGVGPFTNVVAGSYSVTYLANDRCGNRSTCQTTIYVEDGKKPTPYCKNGLITTLMPFDSDGDGSFDTGMIDVTASQLNDGSFDNCTGPLKFSLSPNVLDTVRFYTCDSVGQVDVELWVTDAAGNQDFCRTFLVIQDPNNACLQTITVGGAVVDELSRPVAGVSLAVNMAGAARQVTDALGDYGFSDLPIGGDYSIAPSRDGDDVNGVTTFDLLQISRHILYGNVLNSPYKIIAADVNRSGSLSSIDLLELRDLILRGGGDLPNNQSWRFVRRNYVFQNPAHPLTEFFPESFNRNNVDVDVLTADFVAIKIGDVTNSVNPSAQFTNDQLSDRSASSQALANDVYLRAGVPAEVVVKMDRLRNLHVWEPRLETSEGVDVLSVVTPRLPGFQLAETNDKWIGSWYSLEPVRIEAEATLAIITLVSDVDQYASEALTYRAITADEAFVEERQGLDWQNEGKSTSIVLAAPNPAQDDLRWQCSNLEQGSYAVEIWSPNGILLTRTTAAVPAEGQLVFTINRSLLKGAPPFVFYRWTHQKTGQIWTGKISLLPTYPY